MTKTNVQPIPSNSQHHDTPNNKTHVIKFRVTAEEKASLELTCKLLNLSLSTFIRRAIHNVKIEKTVIVVVGGEATLTDVSTMIYQYSNPDRCFHPACPVQQGGRQPQPACKALQFRRCRHRADPGETP